MKLDFFELQEYDFNNLNHRSVIIELYNDKDSRKYLGDLSYSIEMINKRKENNFLNNAFIAYRNNNPIGYISITTKENNYEISYGILPKYRGENLGMLLLQDFSLNIFKENKNIDELSLIISKDNIKSRKTAISAGYYQENENKFSMRCKK